MSAAKMISGLPRRMRSPDPVGSYVRHERFGHGDASVRTLMVLEDTYDRARQRETGAIQRVNEARLFALCLTKANVRAAGLEVGEVAARGDLQPCPHTRRPRLEIVGHRGGETGVTGGEQLAAVREAYPLEHRLRGTCEQLELLGRALGRGVAYELHLVELVGAQNAAGVLARRSRLTTKAGRVRDESLREHLGVEDLVAIEIRDRHLGGGNEEEILALHRVGIVLELRELTGTRHRGAIHNDGRPHLLVPMLAGVRVDEEVD